MSFGRPSPGPFREDGLYRFSRNPMYVSYFVYFAGCVLLTRSRLLAALVLLFQLSEHWIILAEERWCRGAVRRTLRGVSEAGQAVSLIRVGRRLFPWSIL